MKFRNIILTLLILTFSAAVYGQAITARVDKTVAEVEDEILLTVEVSGVSGDIMPDLPSMPSFSYYSSGMGSGARVVEVIGTGGISSSASEIVNAYMFTLVPRFAGKAEIGPITIDYLGKEYATRPIIIDVYRKGESKGKAAPVQPAAAAPAKRPTVDKPQPKPTPADTINPVKKYDPVFVVNETDKKEAYVGEQITLYSYIYTSVPIYQDSFQGSSFEGLVKEDIDVEKGKKTLGGKPYSYGVTKTALFGTGLSKAKVLPAYYEFLVGVTGNSMVDSLLKRGGIVKTDTIDLTIKPLPSGAGEHFYGAVGEKFSVTAELDKNEAPAGEAATMTLTIKGVGNLKTILAPQVPDVSGLKKYSVAGVTNSTPINDVVQGYKTFKTVFVPVAAGKYIIPEIPFTYFSPQSGSYHTVNTNAVELTVTPSDNSEGAAVTYYGDGAAPSARAIGKDINYIKQNAARAMFNPLKFIASLGVINFIPILLLALAVIVKTLAATGFFERPISKACALVKKGGNAGDLSAALRTFISLKTAIPTGSLKVGDITALLTTKHRVSAGTVQALSTLWQNLDALKFAPGAANLLEFAKLKHETFKVLKALEREIK
ncbi:hypothetical protein AAIR98_001636 [Elusimicrobium simillimum]|uniref:BatD family protein n=1 Tax=Elusimicrobium simillimum TaxID=3143438 RepID=UPI003C6EF29C